MSEQTHVEGVSEHMQLRQELRVAGAANVVSP